MTTAGSSLVRPGRERAPAASARPTASSHRREPRHVAIREHLAARGASFYRELFAAARGELRPRGPRRAVGPGLGRRGHATTHSRRLRALRWKRTGSGGARTDGRPGRLTALGPPEAAGRWSLVAQDADRPSADRAAPRAISLALLERHGVLTREAVATEGIDGGFAAVYPILRAMEEAGRIRRGYFVDGLGAAQFALAGALDRLRAVREPADRGATGRVHLLAAADPANPYGAALPGRVAAKRTGGRSSAPAGAYVVLVDGVAALYLERGGATLQTLPAADDPATAVAAAACSRARSWPTGGSGSWSSRKVDGEAVARVAVPRRAARGRVRRRLSRPRPARRSGTVPECRKATRSSARPPGCGRTWSGATVTAARDRRPGRSRRSHRLVGQRDRRRRQRGQEPPDPVRRRPRAADPPAHERLVAPLPARRGWRRPPSRAALVLEVPGAIAVCFDAPVVELFEHAGRGDPSAARSRSGRTSRAGLRCRGGRSPAA